MKFSLHFRLIDSVINHARAGRFSALVYFSAFFHNY